MNHQLAHRRISTASEPHSSNRAPTNFGDAGDEIEANDNDGRNYKLIIDPALGQGKDKVIRYNGCMPGRDLVPIGVVDPRPRISRYSLSRHSVNLKIPDFQVDLNYVGKILPKEVTLTNLNNNINVAFLQDMCKAFGDIKSSVIFYHPKTKKHLGIAQVIFSSARAAQRCIEKLNETSKMGNIITVFADPSGERRKKLLEELVTDKVIFRPPSPKLQLPVNIMDELKNLAPPPASSSSSFASSSRSNGIGQPPPTSKTASPSTNTTTPRSTNLRSNVYSDPDLLRRSHSNGGSSFPSSQRGDSAFPGRAELPTIRRQSIDPSSSSSSSSVIHHHHQQQQQQSNQGAWNQPVHDQSSQPETRPSFVANHSAPLSSDDKQHQSNSYSENSAVTDDRPNWRGRGGHRTSERRNQTTTIGYVSQSTNSIDGEKRCEGRLNDAYPPPHADRSATVDLGFENSNESFHLARQSNTSASFQNQISREAFKRTKHSPANFTSQNSQEPFGAMPDSSSSHDLLSFSVQQGSREVIARSVDSQQTPTSQLSQIGFWPADNSPLAAGFAQQNSLTNLRQNSLSTVLDNSSESPAALQRSVSAIETIDPRKLKGLHGRDKETKGVRQQQREDQIDRIESREKVDFLRKSSSHDAEMSSRDSKHGSRRHDGSSRHRNHDSSHGRRRSRHKKHRSHHRRHRSSSSERSSSSNARHHQQQQSLSDQRRLSSAPVLPDLPPPLPPLPAHAVALPFRPLPPLPSDCLQPQSNDILSSSIVVADSSLAHPSLESRIQQLLGQTTDERINGFSTGLVFPPPLPPEQPPLPPPAEAELPPLPPEPAPLDEVVDMSMMVEGGGVQHNSGQSNSYGEKTNYIYNTTTTLANCKAGEMKTGSMSRHTGSLPHFNGELIDRSTGQQQHQQQPSSDIPLLSDSFQSELQYQMAASSYWYPPYPHDIHVSNSLPVDNRLYGNLSSINSGLYGNLPFDKAVYSMGGAYGAGAFSLVPGLSGDEQVDVGNFAVILEELVTELKKVMVKDMQKKMVENIGFKVYENWWKNEEGKEKVIMQKPLLLEGVKSKLELKPRSSLDHTTTTTHGGGGGGAPAPFPAPLTSSDVLSLRAASASVTSSIAPTKVVSDSSSSLLWSLFDNNNKDGGSEAGGGGGGGRVGFGGGGGGGGGGLLGLRGAVAKMPSFRKKLPSPLPEKEREDEEEDDEEDEDDEEEGPITFRGPRTPEESENEEDDEDDDEDDEDASSSSLGEEDLANSVKLLQRTHRPSRAFVYSSSSSSGEEEDEEEEEEEEVRPDEDDEASQVEEEEEEEDVDLTAAEESDLDGDQSGLREMERDEGPKQKRRLLLSSEDEDEVVVVVAMKPDNDEICRDVKPRRFPSDAAQNNSPSSSSSLPLLSPAAAVSSSLASRFTHILHDKRTPLVVLTSSTHTISSPIPSAPLTSPCAPLKPDPVVPSESVIEDHSQRLEEFEADKNRIDSLRREDRIDSLKREDCTKNDDDDRLTHDDLPDETKKEQKNKELVLLPTIKALHLVEEWLSAMRLDHAYSLSPTLLHKPKKGRKPRISVQLTNRDNDDDYDANLSDETLSLTDSAIGLTATLPSLIAIDHNYCHPFLPVDEPAPVVSDSDDESQVGLLPVRIITDSGEVLNTEDVPNILMEVDVMEEEEEEAKSVEDEIAVTRKRKRLSDVTNFPGSRELANILPPVVRKVEYSCRLEKEEMDVLHEYLNKGLDAEDLVYLKRQYDELVQEDCPRTYWVNETHWVNHPPTSFELTPPRKRSRMMSRHHDAIEHATGSARTEGYYKISRQAKSLYLRHTRRVDSDDDDNLDDDERRCTTDEVARKKSQQSRDVRSESRRWQNLFTTDLGDEMGDILKFNKLEIRKKQLKFARSRIHDWGLFAKEPIIEGEMVIEYVGEVVRRSVADALEKRYEALGIGSSYLFRVDHNVIIDATKHGNLSRFINHSCSPNCYAKVITVDSEKKIVIYSKRDININDEITYDYKFPLEDEKIPCLCGASGCRGTLN